MSVEEFLHDLEQKRALGTLCLWCRPGGPQPELGAHHAVDCIWYRSPSQGPNAEYWDRLLRQFLEDRQRQAEIPQANAGGNEK